MIDGWYWFFVTKIDISKKKKIHQRKQIIRLKIQIIFLEFMWHRAVIEELVIWNEWAAAFIVLFLTSIKNQRQ